MYMEEGSIFLKMDEKKPYVLAVTLPSECQFGEMIELHIALTMEDEYSTSITIHILILDSYGISLSILNMEHIPTKYCTIYRYLLEAENTGNTNNTFSFIAEGSHPDLIILPPPLTMMAFEKKNLVVDTVVPLHIMSVIDNYLIPVDSHKSFDELNMRIYSYIPELISSIVTNQEGNVYQYTISVTNNGSRYEELSIRLTLPHVNSYMPGHKRWDGFANKGFLAIMPQETKIFQVSVTTPVYREYWGGQLSVSMISASGKSQIFTLPKPPIAILRTITPTFITIEDTLSFTGSRSLWNIIEFQWDFGDGKHASGSTTKHNYVRSGVYTIVLTVIDENDFSCTATQEILIENMAPIPIITTTPLNGTVEAGTPIILDGSHSLDRDGIIDEYIWEFQDYQDHTWPVIEYVFTEEGDYPVSLTVIDNSGEAENITKIIHVVKPNKQPTNNPNAVGSKQASKLSYFPSILLVIVLLGGLFTLSGKKTFVEMLEEKLAQNGTEKSNTANVGIHTVICPKCETPLPDNFRFCNKCGIAIDIQKNPTSNTELWIEGTKKVCTACGVETPSIFNYCNKCGVSLNQKSPLKRKSNIGRKGHKSKEDT